MNALLVSVVALICGCEDGAQEGGKTDASVEGVLIHAAEGGEVAAGDGVFRLVVPPGALAQDTTISISIVPRDQWDDDTIAAEPLADVYDLQPDGLQFAVPAHVIHEWASAPAALGTRGERPFVSHLSSSAGGELAAADNTKTFFTADGRAVVVAEVSHLSRHFATRRVRVSRGHYADVSASFSAEAGSHPVGEEWRLGHATITSSERIHVVVLGGSEVRSSDESFYVDPLCDTGGSCSDSPTPIYTIDREYGGTGLVAAYKQYAHFENLRAEIDPGTPLALSTPLPGWRCVSEGENRNPIWAHIAADTYHADVISRHLGSVMVEEEIGVPTCTAVPVTSFDLSVAGTLQPQSLSDGALVDSGAALTELQIVHADESILSQITPFFDGYVWQGPLTSRADAPSPIQIQTSTQDLTATLQGGQYEITGLDPGQPLFGASDAVTWSDGTNTVTVDAPPDAPLTITPAPPDGALADVAVRWPDGSFDALYVQGPVAGPEGSGFIQLVDPSTLPLDGDFRVFAFGPVVDGLEARGTPIPTTDQIQITIAGATFKEFAGGGQYVAMRGVKVPVSQLVLPTPAAGLTDCAALPATFNDVNGGDPVDVVVCIDDGDAFCGATNDVYEDAPPVATQCYGADRAVDLRANDTTGEPNACAMAGWRLVWSSQGARLGCMHPGGAAGTDQFIEVERLSDGIRRRVNFRTSTKTITVLSVESNPAGPYPAYGAQHACGEAPVTIPAPNTTVEHGSICVDSDPHTPQSSAGCLVYGDISADPNDPNDPTNGLNEQACGIFRALVFGRAVTDINFARTRPPAGSPWTIESASHGTLSGTPPNQTSGFPSDTSVTVVVTDGAQHWQVVFTHVSADNSYIIESVTKL